MQLFLVEQPIQAALKEGIDGEMKIHWAALAALPASA